MGNKKTSTNNQHQEQEHRRKKNDTVVIVVVVFLLEDAAEFVALGNNYNDAIIHNSTIDPLDNRRCHGANLGCVSTSARTIDPAMDQIYLLAEV